MGTLLFDFVGVMGLAYANLVRSAMPFVIAVGYEPQLSSHTTWRRLPVFITQEIELSLKRVNSL